MPPRSSSVFRLLIMRFCELLESVLHFFFAKDCSNGTFGFVILLVKNVSTRSLGQLRDDCEEYDWIYLHSNDEYSPGPLVFFS